MILSRSNLSSINDDNLLVPSAQLFELPEKVLQFGTGVLLRGLPDYYIDKANRNGLFNGRIVVVKSTGNGTTNDFANQDNLYTIYSKGIDNSIEKTENVICASISRVLSAADQWSEILAFVRIPALKVVISNTTEVGIQFVDEPINQHPPISFPAKLLAVLYERYKAFNGSPESGLVIIPTELIVDNGKKLESIILELAHLNNLEFEFMDWLESNNSFCNSLVDRIVPGRPTKEILKEKNRSYEDDLDIMTEAYSLWAIEGDEKIASVLTFSKADKGVVITSDIELFRELKLRLLNGTHTLSCAFAVLSGLDTVKEAMDDTSFLKFITQLVFKEIIQSIPHPIEPHVAMDFARKVLDRFRNPYIKHAWLSIAVQYSAKLKMRVVPLLLHYYKHNHTPPAYISLGFAAFIRFMNVKQEADGNYVGFAKGKIYTVTDSNAEYFSKVWETTDYNDMVIQILSNHSLWDADLTSLPGFKDAVTANLNLIIDGNIAEPATI